MLDLMVDSDYEIEMLTEDGEVVGYPIVMANSKEDDGVH